MCLMFSLRKAVIRKPLSDAEKRRQLQRWRRKSVLAKSFGFAYLAFCLFYVAEDRLFTMTALPKVMPACNSVPHVVKVSTEVQTHLV